MEWPEGLRVSIGPYTDGVNTGNLFSADFEKNEIVLNYGDGLEWKGTGQEFIKKWAIFPVGHCFDR